MSMDMDEVWNELGSAKELDNAGMRTRIILTALDGMNIREAKLLLSHISNGLEAHTLKYDALEMEEAALGGIRHATRMEKPKKNDA